MGYLPKALKNDLYWQSYKEFRKSDKYGILPMTVSISGASTTCHISNHKEMMIDQQHGGWEKGWG